jgi:hypothetical protein
MGDGDNDPRAVSRVEGGAKVSMILLTAMETDR